MVHMAFVRSVHGHGRIKSINTSAAQSMRGVVGILTGQDLNGQIGQVPCAVAMEGLKIPEHYCLAVDTVRYVGEPLAAVIATDRYLARDAAEKIEIDYDPLPAVTDPEKALAKGSPLVHETFPDNLAFVAKLEGGDWKSVEADKRSEERRVGKECRSRW